MGLTGLRFILVRDSGHKVHSHMLHSLKVSDVQSVFGPSQPDRFLFVLLPCKKAESWSELLSRFPGY